jgi:hypothetical protein
MSGSQGRLRRVSAFPPLGTRGIIYIFIIEKHLMATRKFSPSVEVTGLLEEDRKKIKPPKRATLAQDRYSLSHLASILTSGTRLAMLNAVDRLRGRVRVLVELASFSSFQYVRLAAIENLANEIEALVDIAKFCQYSDTRSAAVDELSSEANALSEVSCSSLFADTRLEAVDTLTDQQGLVSVAARSPHKDSRNAALGKIANNSAALKKVAEDSSYRNARLEAIKCLSSDIKTLSSLVLSSRHAEVKKTAASMLSGFVEELDDPDTLAEIAKQSPNEDARYLAVGRLSGDPWALRGIISDARYADAKSTAIMLLSDMVPELQDAEILADVAVMSPYQDCRIAAIERLAGESNSLLSVASKSRFKDSRDQALHMLRSDIEALKSVSKLSRYHDTRKKAHSMVSKPDVFQNELARILG